MATPVVSTDKEHLSAKSHLKGFNSIKQNDQIRYMAKIMPTLINNCFMCFSLVI
jgi:hypothetical protein